jgi:lysozyme
MDNFTPYAVIPNKDKWADNAFKSAQNLLSRGYNDLPPEVVQQVAKQIESTYTPTKTDIGPNMGQINQPDVLTYAIPEQQMPQERVNNISEPVQQFEPSADKVPGFFGDRPQTMMDMINQNEIRQDESFFGKENLKLVNFLKDSEAYRDKGYAATDDERKRGIITVGYGSTGRGVKEGQKITKAEADKFLKEDIETARKAVKKLVKVPLNINQENALISLLFNVGEGSFSKSNALKALNAGDIDEFVYQAFDPKAGFVFQGKSILPGLVNRRQKEKAFFMALS